MEALEAKIKRFLQVVNGCGDGDGDGYGCGYGCGAGDGYGYGCGDGAGDGCGYGAGAGYGCGYGDGYGAGYGCGAGAGAGDGIKSFNRERIYYIDDVPTIIRSVRGQFATGAILLGDFTRSPTYIAKVEDYFAHGSTLREARESALAKAFQHETVEQRIERFKAEFPDFDKEIPAKDLFRWHNILTGSCEQGRRVFARERGIDLDADKFTIYEFVELTRNSYEGDVIKQIIS